MMNFDGMCMHMCVCVCMYVYVYNKHIYVPAYTVAGGFCVSVNFAGFDPRTSNLADSVTAESVPVRCSVCVCMYVCMYTHTHKNMCICVYTYTYAHKYVCIYINTSRCHTMGTELKYVCMCVCVCVCVECYVSGKKCLHKHTHLTSTRGQRRGHKAEICMNVCINLYT
jgi:hypothetical protein